MNNDFMNRVNAIMLGNQPQAQAQPQPQLQDEYGAFAEMVPRQTEIMGQPHMLAYINPQEEQALRDMGGAGMPGPDGIPAYYHAAGHGEGSNRKWNEEQAAKNYVAPTDAYGITLLNNPTRSQEKRYQTARADAIRTGVTPFASTTNRDGGTGAFRGGVEDVRIRDSKADRVAKTAADARAYAASRRVTASPFTGTQPVQTTPPANKPNYQGKNAFREDLANIFTPFDGTEYYRGNLIDKVSRMPATNIGTKTFYGTVGNANDPNTGSYTNPDMFALQSRRSEKGKAGNLYDYAKSNLPGAALGMLTGAPLPLAVALGEWQVGPNPRDRITGVGESGPNKGQEIRQNADGRYYSKGVFGNYYFVGGADGLDPTDFTPVSEGNQSIASMDAMMARNDRSNNMSAGTGPYAETVASAGGGAGGGAGGSQGPTYYDYKRLRKGGGYAMLPDYLKKYIKPGKIDETVRKIVLADGREMYVTPEGRLLDPEDLKNTSVSDEVIRYDTDGNLIA